MQKRVERSISIYPIYQGLVGDLLFYIAIDTLFLTVAKNFSAAQIVSLPSISMFLCIFLQIPVLWVIKRLGNTWSTRVGGLFLLLSAILITFGKSYYVVLFGRLLHDLAATLRNPSFVTIKNNLEVLHREQDYVKVRTAGNTVYAVITMLIAFVATSMFNLNPYLPMYCCIGTCAIGFVLSFFIVDYSKYDRIIPKKQDKKAKAKINYSKFIIMTIIVYGFFYPIVVNGQTDGKLFVQQQLMLDFDLEMTANIIGIIIVVSRIVRVFSNIIFERVYKKMQSKVGVMLPIMLCFAIGLMLFGSFIPIIAIKIIAMSLGYIVILFIRDPFRIYIQDIVLNNTAKEQHQTLLTLLELANKIGTASTGICFTLVLNKYPLTVVMAIMFVIMLFEIVLSIILYKMIMASKAQVIQSAQ